MQGGGVAGKHISHLTYPENGSHNQEINYLSNTNLEIIQKAMEDFNKIQEYMLLAKEENSTKTYAKLKNEYIYLTDS